MILWKYSSMYRVTITITINDTLAGVTVVYELECESKVLTTTVKCHVAQIERKYGWTPPSHYSTEMKLASKVLYRAQQGNCEGTY